MFLPYLIFLVGFSSFLSLPFSSFAQRFSLKAGEAL